MYKRVITISLLILAVVGLLYYANINFLKSENERIQNELQSKISDLQNNRQSMEKKITDIQKKDKPQGSLSLTYADVQSNEMYNEGVVKDAIYGSFNVVARVKNISSTNVYNVKVTSIFLKNMTGSTDIGIDAKAQSIDQLAPGEEKEIQFTGYKVDHPEISQEIIVNVFHPSITDINDVSNMKKINIKSAFPPKA